MEPSSRSPRLNRDESLDAFRGLAIVGMVAANFMADKIIVPPWLKHAPDIGYTLIDLIAPLFVVAMASSFRLSLERRRSRFMESARKPGSSSQESLFSYRGPDWRGPIAWSALGLIGIGSVLSAGQGLVMPEGGLIDWGVLQALGLAEFALLYLYDVPRWSRAVLALALMVVYQVVMPESLPLLLGRTHGGLIGAVDWIALILLADCSLGWWTKPGRQFIAGAALTAVGWAGSLILPLSKNRVSPDYVIVSLGLSLVVLSALRLWYELRPVRKPARPGLSGLKSPIRLFGSHPLGLYLGHELLLSMFVFPPFVQWGSDAPLATCAAQLILLYCMLAALAIFLEWRRPVLAPGGAAA